jgi:hypothetical protein
LLEKYLIEFTKKYKILFGWVTGSSLDNEELEIEYTNWKALAEKSDYSKSFVFDIVNVCNKYYRINLQLQENSLNDEFKITYYLKSLNEFEDYINIKRIKTISHLYNIKVNISKTIESIGDLPNNYFVDFTSNTCVKIKL